jgi:chromosome segregation ATPase
MPVSDSQGDIVFNNRISLTPWDKKRMKTMLVGAAILMLSLIAFVPAHSQQTQSLEERLRAQLRTTTTQLQQAQNELASMKAGQASPAKVSSDEIEALKKELTQSRSQLAAERQLRERQGGNVAKVQADAQAAIDKSNAQIAQFRNAYDELLKLARTSEAERQRINADQVQQKTALAQCESKNQQLYSVGQDILRAYENIDIGDVMSARQPFATKARVRYDEIAQKFGDSLYEGRFDARAVRAPVVTAPDATPAAK